MKPALLFGLIGVAGVTVLGFSIMGHTKKSVDLAKEQPTPAYPPKIVTTEKAVPAPAVWASPSPRVLPGGIAPDANSAVASVVEAAQTGKHPERLRTFGKPTPYNAEEFAKDPDKYLNTIEPSRCFDVAQATGSDSVHLTLQGEMRPQMKVGETIELAVRGVPKVPVSFTAFDGGLFTETKLNSATVRADDQGLAVVHYTATPGTISDVGILAGSPVAVGQQTFVVHVRSAQ